MRRVQLVVVMPLLFLVFFTVGVLDLFGEFAAFFEKLWKEEEIK
jgi:hypothetical protein